MDALTLLEPIVRVAHEAGDAIMQVYESAGEMDITRKDDDSPLTQADLAAHNIIEAKLAALANYPIVSEEGEHDAKAADMFWLVDPLDGTKEFIKRGGDFTVNIALIKQGKPVLGVVYAPVLNVTYAAVGPNAYKMSDGKKQPIQAVFGGGVPKIVASKSHRNAETNAFIKKITPHEETSIGSSLKLCLVAEGAAMLYPRLAPTYGWDTAAGDAIVRAAGGFVQDVQGKDLQYAPKAAKNPGFVAGTKDCIEWQQFLG